MASFLVMAGGLSVFAIRPATGQEVEPAPEADELSPADLYLAQQPGARAAPVPRRDNQPLPPVAPEPPQRGERSSQYLAGSPIVRLASVPNIFGDFYSSGTQMEYYDEYYPSERVRVDIPSAGGGGHLKIADNNKALPTDRVFFMYNHFQNALVASPALIGPDLTHSLDRYTLGVEKMFLDDQWSVEFRMPFTGGYHLSDFGATVGSEHIGNLSVTLKRLLYVSDSLAVAGGLGIETPTGSDTTGSVFGTDFRLHNDAVRLSPWIGFLRAPSDVFFYQGFLQVDVPTNGNAVDFNDTRLGRLSEQPLMYIDLSLGRWLYRDPSARGLRGLAGLVEFHYTTTLQNAMILTGSDQFTGVQFGNLSNRMDIPNLTVGLHAEIARTTVSVGGVFPLRNGSNRAFDAEVQVFLNRYF